MLFHRELQRATSENGNLEIYLPGIAFQVRRPRAALVGKLIFSLGIAKGEHSKSDFLNFPAALLLEGRNVQNLVSFF